MIHNINATNQPLGRLASKIAVILRGKINPTYRPHLMPDEKVVVTNIKNIKFTGKKIDQKLYYRYSGYPGGLRSRTLGIFFEKNPKRVLWLAVYRMLAKNRLRDKIIKNLKIN